MSARVRSVLLILAIAVAVPTDAQTIVLEEVVSGLSFPVAMAHAGDTRLFIVLQAGQIVIWDGTRILPQPFLDIRSLVLSGGERGLLGLTFHPSYAQNGFFYVNYTDRNGDTWIARYTRSAADPNRADPNSARQILFVDQPFANHNGGQLEFGPDGFLYIGLGDGGSGGDPQNRAQNRAQLLGKMLRIDVDGGDPYAVPPSNPFVGLSNARPRSGPMACAIRGGSRSTAQREISGSPTSARATWRRSTSSPRRASAARTTAGGSRKAPSASIRRRIATVRDSSIR